MGAHSSEILKDRNGVYVRDAANRAALIKRGAIVTIESLKCLELDEAGRASAWSSINFPSRYDDEAEIKAGYGWLVNRRRRANR